MTRNPYFAAALIVVALFLVAVVASACGTESTPTPKPTAPAVSVLPTQAPAKPTTPPTAVPTVAPTAVVTTTAVQKPPSLPMNHVGRTVEVCAACHGPAAEKAVLASHDGRTADTCTGCHTCEGCHVSKPKTD